MTTPTPAQTGPGAEALASLLTAAARAFGVEGGQVAVSAGEEGGLVGRIEGEGAERVIGRNGEAIDALQYLAAQIVRRAEGGTRRTVVVDADDYRAQRAELLERLAARAADEAVSHGEEIELDPMSPADRRTIHMLLADRPGVVTRSEGEEPRRFIVVAPSEDA